MLSTLALASILLNFQGKTSWRQPGYHELAWIESPNRNERPREMEVDTIVVHSTVIDTLEKTVGAFSRTSSKVSSHFVIDRDGAIVQCVSTFERAWHAGVSEDKQGRKNVNDFSIGIELVNLNDGKDPYPEKQVNSLRYLILALKRRFPLKTIVSHEFIARPPGRKSDPKGFPWKALEEIGLEIDR